MSAMPLKLTRSNGSAMVPRSSVFFFFGHFFVHQTQMRIEISKFR